MNANETNKVVYFELLNNVLNDLPRVNLRNVSNLVNLENGLTYYYTDFKRSTELADLLAELKIDYNMNYTLPEPNLNESNVSAPHPGLLASGALQETLGLMEMYAKNGEEIAEACKKHMEENYDDGAEYGDLNLRPQEPEATKTTSIVIEPNDLKGEPMVSTGKYINLLAKPRIKTDVLYIDKHKIDLDKNENCIYYLLPSTMVIKEIIDSSTVTGKVALIYEYDASDDKSSRFLFTFLKIDDSVIPEKFNNHTKLFPIFFNNFKYKKEKGILQINEVQNIFYNLYVTEFN